MNKKEWYKNRILWKANQFESLSKSNLKNRKNDDFLNKKCEGCMDSDDEILFLFFNKNGGEWTVITTNKVISYHDNDVYNILLDNIEKLIDLKKEGVSDNNLKYNSNYLFLGKNRTPIWTPSSQVLFALMNILRMFPLRALSN